jgi:hypothetical protein
MFWLLSFCCLLIIIRELTQHFFLKNICNPSFENKPLNMTKEISPNSLTHTSSYYQSAGVEPTLAY